MNDLSNKAIAKQIFIGNCSVEQLLSTLRYARLDQFDTMEEAKDFIKSKGTHSRLITKDEPLTWIQFDKTNTGWVERKFVCHYDSTYDDGEFVDGDVMINTSFSRQSNFLWIYDTENIDDVKNTHWIPTLSTNATQNSGENGASAYDIAVKNGFVGTEAEWLESLKSSGGGSGVGGDGLLLSGTLAIGETTVTLTNEGIHETALISVYTNVFGVNPTNIVTTEGSCVLTFAAQTVEIGIKVRFEYEEA